MQITFLIGFPPKHEAKDWNDILKYSKDYLAFDEYFYQTIKALEHNIEFENEILKSRKKLGIPEDGYTWKVYYNMSDYNRKDITDQEIQKMVTLFKNTPKEVKRIKRLFKLDEQISDQLKDIILMSSVEEGFGVAGINYWLEPNDRYRLMDKDEREETRQNPKLVNIEICYQISKNQIIEFIEENWIEINKRIQALPKRVNNYVSQRDLKIVELRDRNNMSFVQIANQLIKELRINDPFGRINEDSVKTAYKRAKIKILKLTNTLKK